MKAFALAALALMTSLSQQPAVRDAPVGPATGTAMIAGVVVSADTTPAPLRRVLVTLAGAALHGNLQVVTDDAGRFVFSPLPSGRYTIAAEKPAYVKSYYGAKRPGRPPGTPLALAEGQRIDDVVMRLVRGAVVAGLVLDERGAPLPSAQVSVMESVFVNGDRQFVYVSGVKSATTDERGRYRVYGIPAGEYTVQASGGTGLRGGVQQATDADVQNALRQLQNASTSAAPAGSTRVVSQQVTRDLRYFPSADAANAEAFVLAAGEERAGLDVTVPLVRALRIEGTSVGPGGEPMRNVRVSDVLGSEHSSGLGDIEVGDDGTFRMTGVTPGQYTLIGRGAEGTRAGNTPPDSMPLWAETTFDVSTEDVSGLVLRFAPGLVVTGRLRFQGAQSPPELTKIRLSLTPATNVRTTLRVPEPVATPNPDGTFTFTSVAPGKYRVAATGAGTWLLRSAMLGLRDVLDAPLEVTASQDVSDLIVAFTDQPTEVSGTVFDRLGRPTPEYSVVVFSADRAHWSSSPRRMSGAVKLDSDGRYKVSGLPPGEYYVSTVVDIAAGQLADPTVLELLVPSSIKITLGESEKKTQDLRLGGV